MENNQNPNENNTNSNNDMREKIAKLPYEEKVKVIQNFIGDIVQHFKGDFYLIKDVAELEDNINHVVVYKALYGDCKVYARPLEDFFDWIADRPDNVTTNKMRFEPVCITTKNSKFRANNNAN